MHRTQREVLSIPRERRLPIGAEVLVPGEVHFRVWAPRHEAVVVVIEPGPEGSRREVPLAAEPDGYFSGRVEGAGPGTRYWFRLGAELFPDPASRFQPEGPAGPSQVVDPGLYEWRDVLWRGLVLEAQVFYEMHLGTFTRAGTWAAAAEELLELASLGVTAIELMPVAEFPGKFGWGYDGVDLFAPYHGYGEPDDPRRFVDAAHAAGLGVILDVVYNHLGPSGCFLGQFSDAYASSRHATDWGAALSFDGEGAAGVRELVVSNAVHWIDEYHLDGLRLDATQFIHDNSEEHVLAVVVRRAREAARGRRVLIVAENEPQDSRLIRPQHEGGIGASAIWNDDFHHSATVALTGRAEAYYSDFRGTPQELVSASTRGFLYQGQASRWFGTRRGSPTRGLPRAAFVCYLQNHDQIANAGCRVHELTSPGRLRAMTAFLLLGPGTPLLFQGQEFAASGPFHFFADHEPALACAVREGRAKLLSQFPSLAGTLARGELPDPGAVETFERSRLDLGERQRHLEVYEMHRELLRLRREDAVLALQGERGVEGAVLGPEAFALRFLGGDGDDRLLLVNLGADLPLDPVAEPRLGPPGGGCGDANGCCWALAWSSEDRRWGGCGVAPSSAQEKSWVAQGQAAVLLRPDRPAGTKGCRQ
jgi:maltooligosyltrehalose trehalohydrolase